MNSSRLLELQQEWDELIVKIEQQWTVLTQKIEPKEHSSELQDVVKELYNLLDECKEAGQDIADQRERKSLQSIAREIADIIFRLTKEYPAIVILPAESSAREIQFLRDPRLRDKGQKDLLMSF